MALRSSLLHPETPQGFLLAAEERYFDAAELLTRGRTTGAIYLAGFVVEMVLKHAAFRLRGAGPGTAVGPLFGPAMKWAKKLIPTIDPERKHSLWSWAQFVRRTRRELGRPLAPDFDEALLRRVRRLHGNWSVDLRYCENVADMVDAKNVFEDVSWIRKHRSSPWR
ncbi:uncharacterized protein SOCEGT47_038880 [Sorangium cellulosum]|uniref:HEPN domain-containing protein n=1 Tax=Sorangium cellulosum TaxID=56 RepID=A0A4P2Q250_SORCE|nr:hypothetical protein [Sorangium cellulosum]AUX23365.1 uncharacterized protein SOCEGT47_038880 [Sorangium cellulosum]